MRIKTVMGLAFVFTLASPALAAILVASPPIGSPAIKVAGGCGFLYHRGANGKCHRNTLSTPPPAAPLRGPGGQHHCRPGSKDPWRCN